MSFKFIEEKLLGDGSIDCADGSDEGYCNPNDDPNASDPCDLSTCQLPGL